MACVPTCFLTHLLTLYSTCLLTFYLLARQVEATGIAPAYTTSCNASCVLLRRTAQPLPRCRFRALQGHTLFGKARSSARRARCVAIHVHFYVPVSINHSLDLIGRRGASREIPVRRTHELDAHCQRGSVMASRAVMKRVCHSQPRLSPRRRTMICMRSTLQSVDG